MLTALDGLVLVFMALSAASLLAVCLMFLMKHKIVKKVAFYFLALLGMLVACLNALMTPGTYPGELALGWTLGGLSVAALLLELCSKSDKKEKIARILVAVSVIAGMFNAFVY